MDEVHKKRKEKSSTQDPFLYQLKVGKTVINKNSSNILFEKHIYIYEDRV